MTVSLRRSYWMTARQFRNEDTRRRLLAQMREAAARGGYRGRVSLDFDTVHGRDRHLVKVSFWA